MGIAGDITDGSGIKRGKQRRGRFQSARRVVIAGDDDDIQVRNTLLGGSEKTVELLLGGGGRIGIIEDVAGDQQDINLFGCESVEQPVQKSLMLVIPLKVMQGLAEMPIRGMQQTHDRSLLVGEFSSALIHHHRL